MKEKVNLYKGVLIFISFFTFIGLILLIPLIIQALSGFIDFLLNENLSFAPNESLPLLWGVGIIIFGYLVSMLVIIKARNKLPKNVN